MKKLLLILNVSFIGGFVFAQMGPSPSPIAAAVSEPPHWLLELITKFPHLAVVIFIVGGLRLTLKPLFAFGHQFFQAWGLKNLDEAETKIEQSKLFKGVSFVLDYLGSIKLPPPKVVQPINPDETPKAT